MRISVYESGVKDLLGKHIVQFEIDVGQAHLLSFDFLHVAYFTSGHPFHGENTLKTLKQTLKLKKFNFIDFFIPFLCGTNGFWAHVRSASSSNPLHNVLRFVPLAQSLVLEQDSYADHS